MAERRMFAKTTVLSDDFLDMPQSTRCLYFTLGMIADDDGFVNNPKSAMRQSSATTDDLNILVTKKYIVPFDSGVVVITHWKINNYIRNDRYTETQYVDEKAMLSVDKKGVYFLGIPCGIPAVYPGEDRKELGKDTSSFPRTREDGTENKKGENPVETLEKSFSCEALGGIGKNVVLLDDEQMEDLLDRLGVEDFNYYVGVVADCELHGKPYRKKTHYQAILDMAIQDGKIKKGRSKNG